MKYALLALSFLSLSVAAQEAPIQQTNEQSVSKAQYFSWINNTNEGPTEAQTMVNLDFFEWLNREYGMVLDIYAFDAGLIGGAKFYGSTKSARFKRAFPEGLFEVEVYAKGKQLPADKFRASNLFAASENRPCVALWRKELVLDEVSAGSYLCVAIEGEHGEEGAYASVKVGGKYIGAPRRSVSYPSNTWEDQSARISANYTYYIPVDESMANQPIEAYVMGYDAAKTAFKPQLWITAYPIPYEEIEL